jgi:uncharacterized integral membrane protein (TIGR00698 family)
MPKNIFFVCMILCASGLISPPIALAGGVAYAFCFTHPFYLESKQLSKWLLQASVVGLGFGMDFGQVLRVGRTGFLYTAVGITTALALGWALGKALRVPGRVAFLVSAGTAICGGSAIAAVAPIAEASEEEIAVSLGTVFVLNSVALFLFPAIGGLLHMTQNEFGLWAALAIHDTSSVVGAAAKYGAVALAVGTTVKLARALWIVPVSAGAALIKGRSKGGGKGGSKRIYLPWFIVLFCLAAAANSYLPVFHGAYETCRHLGVIGLTVTLFLIGTGLSWKTIRAVGVRPLLQGVLLWIVAATASLALIRAGWIHL